MMKKEEEVKKKTDGLTLLLAEVTPSHPVGINMDQEGMEVDTVVVLTKKQVHLPVHSMQEVHNHVSPENLQLKQ